jgi:hypothetical protein
VNATALAGPAVSSPWPETHYRACELCTHGRSTDAGTRLCTEQTVAGIHRALPVEQARAAGGGCGPDATRMATPWLTPARPW